MLRLIKTHLELARLLNTSEMLLLTPITYRIKDNPEIQETAVITNFGYCKNELQGVSLGGFNFTMYELFKKYEWFDDVSNSWKPFGVEE